MGNAGRTVLEHRPNWEDKKQNETSTKSGTKNAIFKENLTNDLKRLRNRISHRHFTFLAQPNICLDGGNRALVI